MTFRGLQEGRQARYHRESDIASFLTPENGSQRDNEAQSKRLIAV